MKWLGAKRKAKKSHKQIESREEIERRLEQYLEATKRQVGWKWECLTCKVDFTLQCQPSEVPKEWWMLRPGADFPYPWETKRVADITTSWKLRDQKECPWVCPNCGEFTQTVPKQ
jgi:rubrerythrin